MKKFIIIFSFFCFLLLAIFFLLDIFISNRLKKSASLAQGEYLTWNDIYEGKINSDIVVYGSSRAWVHINPELFTNTFNISCYNLGIDGHSFLLQNFRHKELLRYNMRPKTIIHSVDIFTFTKFSQLYNYEQFLPYMLFNKNINRATNTFEGFNLMDFIIPGLRYAGKKSIIDYAFKTQRDTNFHKNFRKKGYMGMEMVWNADLETAKKNDAGYKINMDNSIIQDFEKYLEECKENKTTVILVYTPEYIEGQKFVTNREEVMEVFKSFSNKFQMPFYDYSNDSISYQRKYFYNTQHLNKAGSELFTKLLITDLRRDTSFKF